MAEEQPKRVDKEFEAIITNPSGLSLKLDLANQPAETWTQLDNLDLYVPGSLRKILPATLYSGPFGANANILNFCNYLGQPNNNLGGFLRLLGYASDGKIYDLVTTDVWCDISTTLF